jgi:hypothetical protein
MANKKPTVKDYLIQGDSEKDTYNGQKVFCDIINNYRVKYYNYFMSLFKWDGISEQQEDYIMRKFYAEGTVACWKIANTDLLGFSSYAAQEWDMYDSPSKILLINARGVSNLIVPNSPMVVDKDVVIGWVQKCKKPICSIVEYYIQRMAQIDMVCNTNIERQKMPFLVGVDTTDAEKMKDITRRILNNELVIFADLQSLAQFKSVQTANATPMFNELHAYRVQLENELLSYLGIDNEGSVVKATQTLNDEVNANNALINLNQSSFKVCLQKFVDTINKLFGTSISCKYTLEPARALSESAVKSEAEGGGIDMAKQGVLPNGSQQ